MKDVSTLLLNHHYCKIVQCSIKFKHVTPMVNNNNNNDDNNIYLLRLLVYRNRNKNSFNSKSVTKI